MSALVSVHIVLLQIDADIWCDSCCVLSAQTMTYAIEDGEGCPLTVRTFTYCDTCEEGCLR